MDQSRKTEIVPILSMEPADAYHWFKKHRRVIDLFLGHLVSTVRNIEKQNPQDGSFKDAFVDYLSPLVRDSMQSDELSKNQKEMLKSLNKNFRSEVLRDEL